MKNKINGLNDEDTNLKLLYLNFEGNSPYQNNFIFFCENYLNNNKNISIIVIDKIGIINYDYECLIKKRTQKQLNLPNLEQIYYQKDIDEKNEDKIQVNIEKDLKNFINLFFDYTHLSIYRGYDNDNNLLYYNITKKFNSNDLDFIFKNNNIIESLILIKENIEIKYDRYNNHLIFNNLDNGFNYNLSYYKEFIKNFNINELTINGFNHNIKDITNSYIVSLNIFNNYYSAFSIIKIIISFKNLKYLKLSGNSVLLNEIKNNIDYLKIKEIIFYSENKIDYNNKDMFKKFFIEKGITLKIYDIKKLDYI